MSTVNEVSTEQRIFIVNNSENVGKYYSVAADKIEKLYLYDTYGRYGQQVGHTDAGDYHIENHESDFIKDLRKAIKKEFGIKFSCDDIRGNDQNLNSLIDEQILNKDVAAIVKKWVEGWIEKNQDFVEVWGFTYWDGNNFQTIVTQSEHSDTNFFVVDDKELIAELNEAIENKKHYRDVTGIKIYRSGKWEISDSCWQGVWAEYEIEEIDENE